MGSILTHRGLVMPYGIGDFGQHWRHQAFTWTDVDLSSVGSCGMHSSEDINIRRFEDTNQ